MSAKPHALGMIGSLAISLLASLACAETETRDWDCQAYGRPARPASDTEARSVTVKADTEHDATKLAQEELHTSWSDTQCHVHGAATPARAARPDVPKTSPLDKLTFGDYLGAVYNNDADKVRKLDDQYVGESRQNLRALKRNPLWGKLLTQVDESQITLMVPAMRSFLKNYGELYAKCLKSDYVTYTIRTTTRNGYGVQKGAYDTEYRMNKEFAEAFKATAEIGPQTNLGDMGDALNGGHVAHMEDAIANLMGAYRCDDPVIVRFQANLLGLFWIITAPS